MLEVVSVASRQLLVVEPFENEALLSSLCAAGWTLLRCTRSTLATQPGDVLLIEQQGQQPTPALLKQLERMQACNPAQTKAPGTLQEYILQAERKALDDVLARYSSNMSQAARSLGISRPTFYRLLHKHQLR